MFFRQGHRLCLFDRYVCPKFQSQILFRAISTSFKDTIVKNEDIVFPNMRVVMKNSETGESTWQIMSRNEALQLAKQQSLDLILVNGNSDPPVCKLDNFGKILMDHKRKEKEIKSNQKARSVKEIMIGALIDQHDLGIKMNKMREFLSEGHQVKVSIVAKARALKTNPTLLDEMTLRVVELVEKDVSTVQQPHNPSLYRREFLFNPKSS